MPGAHHRFSGVLGLGVVPISWLALALRFDGRINRHPRCAGRQLTGTGDPRLLVRAGHALGRALSLGGELVLWFPGNDAPSFEPRATTVGSRASWPTAEHLRAARARRRAHRPERRERARPEAPPRRRPGRARAQRLERAAARARRRKGLGARAQLFGEVSLDWLLGERAPPLRASPMRATVGARRFFTPGLQGELAATVALSTPELRAERSARARRAAHHGDARCALRPCAQPHGGRAAARRATSPGRPATSAAPDGGRGAGGASGGARFPT